MVNKCIVAILLLGFTADGLENEKTGILIMGQHAPLVKKRRLLPMLPRIAADLGLVLLSATTALAQTVEIDALKKAAEQGDAGA